MSRYFIITIIKYSHNAVFTGKELPGVSALSDL